MFFSLVEATRLGEGKLSVQTCQFSLKNWPCVISCRSGVEGQYKYAYYNRRRKWNQWLEFKSWTRLLAFHFKLMLTRKAWIHASPGVGEQVGKVGPLASVNLPKGTLWIYTSSTPLNNLTKCHNPFVAVVLVSISLFNRISTSVD